MDYLRSSLNLYCVDDHLVRILSDVYVYLAETGGDLSFRVVARNK